MLKILRKLFVVFASKDDVDAANRLLDLLGI